MFRRWHKNYDDGYKPFCGAKTELKRHKIKMKISFRSFYIFTSFPRFQGYWKRWKYYLNSSPEKNCFSFIKVDNITKTKASRWIITLVVECIYLSFIGISQEREPQDYSGLSWTFSISCKRSQNTLSLAFMWMNSCIIFRNTVKLTVRLPRSEFSKLKRLMTQDWIRVTICWVILKRHCDC